MLDRRFTLWLRLDRGLCRLCCACYDIHNPLLDHPAWRQGDTASIARNFATLQYNIMYPQTNYDGPPPNYVELELQIVPFLAASLYKVFGVHEIFGRLITLAFQSAPSRSSGSSGAGSSPARSPVSLRRSSSRSSRAASTTDARSRRTPRWSSS